MVCALLSVSLPVAIIKNASRADQQSVLTTLAAMLVDLHTARIGSPAIIVVGENVRYARQAIAADTEPTLAAMEKSLAVMA